MNDNTNIKSMTIDTIERQRKYVESQKGQGLGGIIFADAFLRGMRDLGYKNPAWALAEQFDNSFQAGADTVEIRFGHHASNGSKVKPDQVAILDNGNGMIPEMISYAVRWGGTDRENDRNGFGRYGYGLPSSAVSLAKRYTVYSKANGSDWHSVTVDIEELASASGNVEKTEQLLKAIPAAVPAWISAAMKGDDKLDISSLTSGTIVVLEKLDRLNRLSGWMKGDTLRTKLLQHFGVIYRHWIPERRITVDGMTAGAVDPLFLMEHGRFYDETLVRAQRVEARTIEVETPQGTKGVVTVRASLLPPNFQLVDPAQYEVKGAKNNKRADIMRSYNGLLLCRERRQIDCIAPRWTKFQNNDANIKIEIDFDPELDEFFGITTAKQQITIDDAMWEQLQHSGTNGGGLVALVKDLRGSFSDLQTELKAKSKNKGNADEPRASEAAMEQSEKYKAATPEPTAGQADEAERNLQQEAQQRADTTGRPTEEVLAELQEKTAKRRWELEFAAIPEGPFYRPIRLGMQKRLVINTDHPFYTKIYEPAPDNRSALEVMLFVLAERELEVRSEFESFYKSERQRWSERLRYALDSLMPEESMVDKNAALAERLYEESEA